MTWLERSRPLKRSKPMARSRIKRGGLPRRVTRPGPGSDPAYLQRVRGLPCRALGSRHEGDVVAHHAGPKTNDSTAVPLCFGHHRQWHDGNGVFKGWDKSARRDWADIAIASTRAWLDAEHTASSRCDQPGENHCAEAGHLRIDIAGHRATIARLERELAEAKRHDDLGIASLRKVNKIRSILWEP